MPSALATQLAQGTSLNADLLRNTRKRRHYGSTYLFSSEEAAQHDLDSIYALGQNGFAALCALDTRLEEFGRDLFSNAARAADRTVVPPDQLAALQDTLPPFMTRMSMYLMEPPAGKVIEWLVRRFRINEFNVSLVLECFLPYHESSQFSKMLSILAIESNSLWSFLLPFKKSSKALPRTALITAMIKNVDLARLATGLFVRALENNYWHRTLLNFSTSIAVEYISRIPVIDQAISAFLLPAVIHPLTTGRNREIILGHFVILSSFSQRVVMTHKAFKAVVKAVLQTTPQVAHTEVLAVLVAVSGFQADPVLPKSISKLLKASEEFQKVIPESLTWRDADKFYTAIVSYVLMDLDRLTAWRPFLLAVIRTPLVSSPLIEKIIGMLLSNIQLDHAKNDSALATLLSEISQRHPLPFRSATANYSRTHEFSNITKEEFDGLIAGLSLDTSFSGAKAVVSAKFTEDVQTGLSNLRDLLRNLASVEPGHASKAAQDTLLSTLQDSDPDVINLLYSSPNVLLEHIPQDHLKQAIVTALNSSELPRIVFREHLTFLSKNFCKKWSTQMEDVFRSCIWRYLLFTRAQQKLAQQAWKTIEESKLKALEVLDGCVELVVDAPDNSQMAAINLAVSRKMAHNILVSKQYHDHFDFLISELKSENSRVRGLACLVLRALLNELSGGQRVDAACQVLENLGLKSMDKLESTIASGASLGSLLDYDFFAMSLVTNPSSSKTLHRLQANILALLPYIPRPESIQIEWLEGRSDLVSKTDTASQFVKLTRSIYALVNSASSFCPLATTLLQGVFVNIKDEALVFLVGVCTDEHSPPSLQRLALDHAKAFLLVQLASQTISAMDFQVIVPALLVALSSSDRSVRTVATECIECLHKMHSDRRASVYAVDSIYGKHTSALQILSYADVGKYITALVERRDSFVADASYFPVFNRETLVSGLTFNKAKMFKHRIVCYLLSHVVCWNNPSARLALLMSVRHVPDPAKLTLLLPLVEELFNATTSLSSEAVLYRRVLFEVFDAESAEALNEEGSHPWGIFLQSIRRSEGLATSGVSGAMRSVALAQLERVLFKHLSAERKVQICQLILDLVPETEQQAGFVQLRQFLMDVVDSESVIGTLPALIPSIQASPERSTKRTKLDQGAIVTTDTVDLQSLTFFAEAIASRPALRSVEALRCLFDSLQRLADLRQGGMAVDYVSQTLLVALDKAVTSFNFDLPASCLRIDVLVNLVRLSQTPQMSHQALLVISNAAKVVPEAVIHHVMPIFTFMGSSVFHRDDSYSFRVVQKAVESIVPVMTKTLKDTHPAGLELSIGSRDFLRIFTDASSHVPRHRRTHFFTHFIHVLGPEEYLAAVIMLLVEKSASKIVRQETQEALQTVGLPLAALAKYPHNQRLSVLLVILEECQRLVIRAEHPNKQQPRLFLDVALDDHAPSVTAAMTKQATASLIFVSFAIRAFNDEPHYRPSTGRNSLIQGLLSLLVSLANQKELSSIGAMGDVKKAARAALVDAFAVIPASDFVHSVAELMDNQDLGVRSSAVVLLTDRVGLINPQVRATLKDSMLAIIDRLCAALTGSSDMPYVLSLRCLGAIAASGCGSEHVALSRCIDCVIESGGTHDALVDALQVLSTLIEKLGPRMIPHANMIIKLSLKGLEISDSNEAEERQHHSQASALQTIKALLSSIPTFLGADLAHIIAACVTISATGVRSAVDILGSISVGIPSRILVPTLVGLWSEGYSLAKSSEVEQFLNLFKTALKVAPRLDVTENLKSLFKMFLEMFDLRCRIDGQDITRVETGAIMAFLEIVTKLNESTFKPLFRRTFDWAFTSDSRSEGRQVTFTIFMLALLKTFKSLVTPYLGMIIGSVVDVFERFDDRKSRGGALWLGLVHMLDTSFIVDEGVFWRDDRLESIMSPLVKQISASVSLELEGEDRCSLITCLAGFAHAANREELLKALNLGILMETRSEDLKIQTFALDSLAAIWKREGARTSAFASETIAFIEDLAESENDLIVKKARKFKQLMDSMSGAGADGARM
ncbi:snoRNA-binding rRNA-processing protein utp10 [Tulasnella sp. 332]|nr:snoRNA-binding rRNA-processing protein utp10 [Tulasnella sp. 332]